MKLEWRPSKTPDAFLAVFLVALVVRAGAIVALSMPLPGMSTGGAASIGTSIDGYHEIALQLAQGHGFAVDSESGPTAARAPLYPMLVAALYRVFGPVAAPVMWAHAILGALTCALLFLLGRRMFDAATGLTAGTLFAFYPPHLAWSWYIMSETLLVLLLVASCLALVRLLQVPSHRRALAAGALFGLTALCNSVILFLPPILLFAAAVARRYRRAYLHPALLLLVTMWAVVLPWTARNQAAFHRLIPVNWGAGWTYMKGLLMVEDYVEWPGQPMWKVDQAATEELLRLLRSHGFGEGRSRQGMEWIDRTGIAGLEEEEFLKRLTWEWVRGHPLGAARKFAVNLGLYWYFSRHSSAYKLLNFPLCLLALLGLALGAWRRDETRVVVGFSLYFYFTYAVMMACARYSLQIMPFVSVLAAAALVDLARRARTKGRAGGLGVPGPA